MSSFIDCNGGQKKLRIFWAFADSSSPLGRHKELPNGHHWSRPEGQFQRKSSSGLVVRDSVAPRGAIRKIREIRPIRVEQFLADRESGQSGKMIELQIAEAADFADFAETAFATAQRPDRGTSSEYSHALQFE